MLIGSGIPAVAQIAMPDTVCVGTTRLYQVNDPTTPSTYTWKIDGITQAATKNEIPVTWNTAGTFLLSVQEHSTAGCDGDIRSGLVIVNPLPVANAGPDSVICFGSSIQLNGSGGGQYQWSPPTFLSNAAIAKPIATVPGAGIYKYVLSVSSNSCQALARDTVIITMLPPARVFAGNDTSIAINQPLQLNAVDVSNSLFSRYTWSPSFGLSNAVIQNPLATLSSNITYTVTAQTANGCVATDDITIKVYNRPEIYVPTAFTPNKDGLNDLFKPTYIGIVQVQYFSVFNRYGQLLFNTTSQSAGWDGTLNGERQSPMAYVWMVKGVGPDGRVIQKKGTVVLIR